MNLQVLIVTALKASTALSVFAIGLNSRFSEGAYLLSRPTKLARSFFAMDLIMPVFAAATVWAFDLPAAIEVSLVALAISPVPPVLPKKQIKAHGEPSYAIGLSVLAAAVAIVFIPIAIELLSRFFQTPAHMGTWPIAQLVFVTVLAPLATGMLIKRFAPAIALRAFHPVAFTGAVLLVIGILPVLFTAWPAIIALVGNGTILAVTAFVFFGLAIGHLLGGPDPHDRTVLALATATRHPGIALAIGATNFPELKAIQPAILLYVFVCVILTAPYVVWRKRVS